MPKRSPLPLFRTPQASWLAAFGLVALLAGCAVPVDERGWVPTGANEANLRAMIADPQDLERGRGTTLADGDIDVRAVGRWRRGEIELPQTGSGTSVGGGNGGS